MNKIKTLVYLILLLLLSALVTSLTQYILTKISDTSEIAPSKFAKYDGIYKINGTDITLKDGAYEDKIKYFGNDVFADFDKDGNTDVAFLITKQDGGSGTFYYLVARLNKTSGSVGSDAVFIGDRIAPQSTDIADNNIIVVNYADRGINDSFTTPPSIGKSLYLKLNTDTMQFGQVVKDFEGEADTNKMTLTMKKWVWNTDNKFTITFKNDGIFSASTDCNGIGGNYTADKTSISFKDIMSTMMYCEGSKESSFRDILSNANSYRFTSKGELIISTKDSKEIILR